MLNTDLFQAAPTDPLRDTAEIMSQAGSASVKTCLRKGRKPQVGGGGGKK